MGLPITSFYAALTTLIFMVLSWRVITYRRANRISLGDTGDKNLLKRMRAQANWAEYAPIALILLVLTELNGAPAIALHLLGAGLVLGRFLHAYGFGATPQKMMSRQLGMVLTLLVIGLAALGLMGHALI